MFLSEQEIQEITNKQRYSAQRRELDNLRVPYRTRSDGRPLVLRITPEAVHTEPEPNWDAI